MNFSLQAAKLYYKEIYKAGDTYPWETEFVKHFYKAIIVCRDKFIFSCEEVLKFPKGGTL